MDTVIFPHLNAVLNSTSAMLLSLGLYFIRKGNRKYHITAMAAALICSTIFLASYLYYHAQYGSRPFLPEGFIRKIYFTILITHSILAAIVVPMVLKTVYHAVRKQWDTHKKWARWTWPVWLYVSVTGVVVYGMLYHMK